MPDLSDTITFRTDLDGVDWLEMKTTLAADRFDNGRTAVQLCRSFVASHGAVIAYAGERIIGTARVLSDGVCNAYIVDVWTLSAYRRRGIASRMVERLLAGLDGQHVCLFTDDQAAFYERLGFTEERVGMSQVVGQWLVNGSDRA